MTAAPDQLVYHQHQGRMGPFQVSRQESDDAPFRNGTIKMFESGRETLLIQVQVFYFVPAGDRPGGPAAFENGFRDKITGSYGMRLEEADRQERDLFQVPDSTRLHPQDIDILAIEGVVGILKAENVQRTTHKILFGQGEYIVGGKICLMDHE